MKKIQQDENETRGLAAIGAPKKRTFDAKAIQARKQAQEQTEEAVKILDPKGIRLTEIPNNLTEDELRAEIQEKFGQVERIFMPMDAGRLSRNRGFAICNFKNLESATRSIQEGEICINFAVVLIAQSY